MADKHIRLDITSATIPPDLDGLPRRYQLALAFAGFTTRHAIRNELNAKGGGLLNIPNLGKKGLETIRQWLGDPAPQEMARLEFDVGLTAAQLDDRYNPDGGGEHPIFTRSQWRRAVGNEETLSGYWEWVCWVVSQTAQGEQA